MISWQLALGKAPDRDFSQRRVQPVLPWIDYYLRQVFIRLYFFSATTTTTINKIFFGLLPRLSPCTVINLNCLDLLALLREFKWHATAALYLCLPSVFIVGR